MAVTRLQAVAGLVVALAVLQVLVEDALVFLGATGSAPSASWQTLVAVPLAVVLALAAVLVGGALFASRPYR